MNVWKEVSQKSANHCLQSNSGLSKMKQEPKKLVPHPDGKTIRRPK